MFLVPSTYWTCASGIFETYGLLERFEQSENSKKKL